MEYIIHKLHIWASESNLQRMKNSKHYFIDGTFIHTINYTQTIVVMYIDTITGLKIPGIYSLLTNKGDDDYNYLFEYINTLIYTNEEDSNSSKKTITVDFEVPLINNIKKHFKDFRMIGCFFHYKQALFRNAQKFKLTTKSKINQTLNLINNFLGLLPFKKVFNLSTFNI